MFKKHLPTFGAPSWSTRSAFQSCSSALSFCLKVSVVISPTIEIVFGISLIGTRSTPITIDFGGIYFLATCIQEPGAAHKSTHNVDFARKSNFVLSCINLYAARARYPVKKKI